MNEISVPRVEFKSTPTDLDRLVGEPGELISGLSDKLSNNSTIVVSRALYTYVQEHIAELRVMQSFAELVWSFLGESTTREKEDFKRQIYYTIPLEVVAHLEKLQIDKGYDLAFKELCGKYADLKSSTKTWYPIDLFLQFTPSHHTVLEQWQLLNTTKIVEQCKSELSEKTALAVQEKLDDIAKLLIPQKGDEERPIQSQYPSGKKRDVLWLDEDISEDILAVTRLTHFAFIGIRPHFMEAITEALSKVHNQMPVEDLTLRNILDHGVLCRRFAQLIACDVRYRRCAENKTQLKYADGIKAEYRALLNFCFKNVRQQYTGSQMNLVYDDTEYLREIGNKTDGPPKKKK